MLGVRKKYRRVLPFDTDMVVNMYLAAHSMRDISVLFGISKTKVHDILHDADSAESLIFLRHKLAVNLRKGALNMKQYADLIRARNILAKQDIQHAKDIPSKISDVVDICYKLDLHPQVLVNRLGNFRTFISSMGEVSTEVLETKLDSWFENWGALNRDVDRYVQICGWFRAQIDTLKRPPSQSSGS